MRTVFKGCGKDPNFSELAEEFNVSHSTLGHQFNGCISKQEDGIKCLLISTSLPIIHCLYLTTSFLTVGGKPPLRWFFEADDPETLLEDSQHPNGAFSPPAPIKLATNAMRQLFMKRIMENGLMRMVSAIVEALCNSIKS